MQPYGNAWYAINFEAEKGKWNNEEEAVMSRDKIKVFIEEACKTYGLDENNVTLLGFSQGTILSYAVALSYPGLVKNVIALSGYINENIILKDYKANNFQNLKIYVSHGSVDQVIPVSWAQQAPNILKAVNIDHVYEEFPVGHGVAPQNFYSFKSWLQDKI
jgi:phospholipase/carboxylesterase